MTTAIVGYTGFVGSNLCATTKFDAYYNSKNIEEGFGTCPDLLVYSGVRAEMFLANKFPEKDLEVIENAIENIEKINPKRVVLISTIAVYNQTFDVDEYTVINKEESTVYGRNRRLLEEWVEQNYTDSLVVRLPGIYGINLKKNFLYDMINIIPAMLTEAKYNELAAQSALIKENYAMQDNGFAKCLATDTVIRKELKSEFLKIGFTALLFTDSRGIFQYFHLSRLWALIEKAMTNDIRVLNVAVEPITIEEIYNYVYDGKEFKNELNKSVPHFDFKTIHTNIMGGKDGYILDKATCLKQIKDFVIEESK
ncbi:NAD-dependent epimerase/dehydratase family protein [uncultured Bacteroides sp.]|uniref:NAD-dependent epimerase/dehydratase family protein n=1 Tax=uncultured Bacteroides sp. TaxID=162156 RepID=UPI0026311CF9|nr:NAD-dependent epimerase/dehydratase family protein [uncultured Bacteroides sp.]